MIMVRNYTDLGLNDLNLEQIHMNPKRIQMNRLSIYMNLGEKDMNPELGEFGLGVIHRYPVIYGNGKASPLGWGLVK